VSDLVFDDLSPYRLIRLAALDKAIAVALDPQIAVNGSVFDFILEGATKFEAFICGGEE